MAFVAVTTPIVYLAAIADLGGMVLPGSPADFGKFIAANPSPVRRAGIDEYQSEAQFCCRLLLSNKRQAPGPWGLSREGTRNARSIRALRGCLRGSKPSRRDRGTHWEGRLRGLRGRRSLPGPVSDPARSRCGHHHDAAAGRGALDLTVSNVVHPPSVHRQHLRRNPT